MATALKWLAIKSLWITVTGVVSRFGLTVKRQAGKRRDLGTKFTFDPGFPVLLAVLASKTGKPGSKVNFVNPPKRPHYIGDTASKRATSRQRKNKQSEPTAVFKLPKEHLKETRQEDASRGPYRYE